MKALKAGSISTTRAIAAIEGIHSHFDNIYNETVSFFSPTDRAQRPLGQYAK
jgi:hypothetical protein